MHLARQNVCLTHNSIITSEKTFILQSERHTAQLYTGDDLRKKNLQVDYK